ncbi:hypothetical protein BWQ92_18000 [Arthrobacter sp. QXT-31]|nr:hypothetical protein BWQ92_18000 [Arthrobacter sp. QXT-31]
MTAPKRPHLLYVAWGFPPSRGAGVYRALATANAFVDAGWKVTVLTATREVFEFQTGTDIELERKVDPRLRIVRAPFSWIRGEPDLAKWSRARIASNLLWSFMRAKSDRMAFPEPVYGGWKKALLDETDRIHQDDPVDLVIGTANPNVDFMPGWHLYKKAGIPYVMDYRDTWHLNVYTDTFVGSRLSRSARLEEKLLRSAAEVWFVNAPIRDWHAKTYPAGSSRFQVVANAFDPDFAQAFAGMSKPERSATEGLVFGYLGTIYGPMPLRESLEGWRIARSRSELLRNSRFEIHGRLGHYSEPDPAILALLKEYAGDGVTYEGPVSKTAVADKYKGFDALMLILGKSKYVTSGKVFEYAASGLPIASLHHPETASTSILSGHQDWFPVPDLLPESIAETILKTAQRAAVMTSGDYARNQAWADHLSRDKQLQPRIGHLTELVAEANNG